MTRSASVRLLCALLCALVLPAHAAVLHVAPSGSDNNSGTAAAPYATIQAAVNNAKAGDTVALAGGTYAGNGNRDIDFGGKVLTVSGSGAAIMDLGGSEKEPHRGFHFHDKQKGARVEGITLTNGFLSGPDLGSAALIEPDCAAAFVFCRFTANDAQFHRGGCITNSGTVTLTDCIFTDNPDFIALSCDYTAKASLSGCTFQHNRIGVDNVGILLLTDCTFSGNSNPEGSGGGLHSVGVGIATAKHCTFTGNHAKIGGGVDGRNVVLADCTFTGNSADDSGGGLCSEGQGIVSVARCIFQDNKALTGGGLVNTDFSHMSLTNCVLAGNTATDGNGGGLMNLGTLLLQFCSFSSNSAAGLGDSGHIQRGAFMSGAHFAGRAPQGGAIENDGSASLTNCLLWGDTAQTGTEIALSASGNPKMTTSHCDILGGQSGPGNIKADPRFVSAMDLHLGIGSPCRHAGIAIPGVTTDAGKKPRSTPPSIGAYE